MTLKNTMEANAMELFYLAEAGDAAAIWSGEWSSAQLDARDEAGRTALMRAAIRGDYRVIEALKACGANLDLRDPDGNKAVHLAALYGQGIAIIYLIEGGCGA